MQWIYVMYTTKKIICDVFIEMHEQWTKKYYGNHCTVQYCTVQFCFEIKHATSAASWYRPLLGSSLWELEGLRTEWHMELSPTGAN